MAIPKDNERKSESEYPCSLISVTEPASLSRLMRKPAFCIMQKQRPYQLQEPLSLVRVKINCLQLGDNCIQICHLGRYIVGYTVGNFVSWQRVSRAVKHDFRSYIRRYTSPNDKLEYGYPHSNVLFQIYTSKSGICLKNITCMSDIYLLR